MKIVGDLTCDQLILEEGENLVVTGRIDIKGKVVIPDGARLKFKGGDNLIVS